MQLSNTFIIVKYILIFILLMQILFARGQELYIYTEPASNIPAKSVSTKLSTYYAKRMNSSHIAQRYNPAVYIGISKNMMLKTAATFADMNTSDFRFESFSLYGKYRFLSNDDPQRHFRMAIFVDGAVSRAPYRNEEISLLGDKSGVEAGVVATQLIHKLAISSTISHTQVLTPSRFDKSIVTEQPPYQAMNYYLSAGYLLFPRKYENYEQTNLNLYAELITQQTLDKKKYFIDFAPGIQFIFNSNSKLNLGYRVQLKGNMTRMANNSVLLSFERTFFGFF